MGHYVYKYVFDDEIVYVGKNDTDLHSRIYQHTLEEKFQPVKEAQIYFIELQNSIESRLMEELLINKYKPLLNVACKQNGVSISIEEPIWKKYDPPKKSKQRKNIRKEYETITISDCFDSLQVDKRRFLSKCAKSICSKFDFKTFSEMTGVDNDLDAIRRYAQDIFNTNMHVSNKNSWCVFPWVQDFSISPSKQTVEIVLGDIAYAYLSNTV